MTEFILIFGLGVSLFAAIYYLVTCAQKRYWASTALVLLWIATTCYFLGKALEFGGTK
jgi:hypothetical protein